jgi:hypothetical protein
MLDLWHFFSNLQRDGTAPRMDMVIEVSALRFADMQIDRLRGGDYVIEDLITSWRNISQWLREQFSRLTSTSA